MLLANTGLHNELPADQIVVLLGGFQVQMGVTVCMLQLS